MKRSLTILCFYFCSAIVSSQTLQSETAIASLKSIDPGIRFKHDERVLYSPGLAEQWIKNKKPSKAVLGYSHQNREVEAYYFPGSSDKKALIIAGMHGSELSAIEVAKNLIELLSSGEMPYYNVIIIPELFPDNAWKATQVATKSTSNFGRYSTQGSVDPNRQMPALGTAFSKENPVDLYGRTIERENQFLLQLIEDYQPLRIINLHAIKDITKAGIYADPRTDCNGYALGFETDSSLAVSMAQFIQGNGGDVPGNCLQQTPTALYCHDPEIAPAGAVQQRNLHGSALSNNRGYGVSLGGWASTAVCTEKGRRNAARLITIEFPGYKPSFAYKSEEKKRCRFNIQLYAMSVRRIFLEANETE